MMTPQLIPAQARSTTAMSDAERSDIRDMANKTMDVLQKASAGANHMGSRYSRLLQLLWRKKRPPREHRRLQSIDNVLQSPPDQTAGISNADVYDPNTYGGLQIPHGSTGYTTTFSWLDLGAACSYATQNDTISGSGGEMEDVLGDTGSSGISPYEMNFNTIAAYNMMSDNNLNLIF
jgi:hypothetical protein